ncbi:hypothetical protein EHQ53_00650 [Leptospira langatensis]|uniref:Uncharacterized protein n=1 Tax=Leptospira langatensis TaxID=2484983 RepID=A0A5F1ZWY2_9LEPT|nr:hypothetical protein [Leptospira langatensis]TGJ98274.1 hypothetical protein EHO57_16795 [Leptospira langatensis]TGL43188.1 hypothetical protein EHQ53_00650 [Leptospira langatensis]
MQFFAAFFPSIGHFPFGSASFSVWIDGEVLALGGISFTLLSLFGYVVHTQIDRKEEAASEEEAVGSPSSDTEQEEGIHSEPKDQSQVEVRNVQLREKDEHALVGSSFDPLASSPQMRTYEEAQDFLCHRFYFPIGGKTYEAIKTFLDSIPSSPKETWEVLLYNTRSKLETVASKTGSILVFPSETREGSEILPGTVLWKLEWESSPLGEVRLISNEASSLGSSEMGLRLDKLIEQLILAGESQDEETGWGSYSFFSQNLEEERSEGEDPKILVLLEFGSVGNLVMDLKSFGRWWTSRMEGRSPLSRIRKNRVAAILAPGDWMRFQESLSGLMEFLGPDRVELNVGASIRIRKGDSEWESRAKKALHSSKEEGPNRFVCL